MSIIPCRFKVLLASLTLLCSLPIAANNLEIALSDHTARFELSQPVTQGIQSAGSFLYHEDDGEMLSFAMTSRGYQGDISGGVGGQFSYISVDSDEADESGYGIAIGGDVMWRPNQGPFAIKFHAWHAPSVTSFSDVEDITLFGLRFQYEVFTSAIVFIGYRDYSVEFEDYRDEAEIHEGGYGGIVMRF